MRTELKQKIAHAVPSRPLDVLRTDSGFVMFSILLIVGVLLVLGLFGSRNARIEMMIANNDLLGKKAQAVAEAGANHAIRVMIDDRNGYPYVASTHTAGSLAATGGTVKTYGGQSYLFVAFGGGPNDGYYLRGDPAGYVNASGDYEYTKLRSVGVVGQTERVIEVMLSGPTLTPQNSGFPGFFAIHSVSISSSYTDGYNSGTHPGCAPATGSAAGCTGCGDVGTNATTTLSGSTVVDGDFSTAASTIDQGGTVTGSRITGADAYTPPAVPTCGPPYSSGAGLNLTGSAKYLTGTNPPPCTGCQYTSDPTKQGQLTVNANSSIDPGTYCFSTVTLSGGKSLTVTGQTVINTTGKTDMSGGSISNTTCLPSNMVINSSVGGDNMVTVSGGTGAYMVLNAPRAGVVVSGGNSNLWGSIIGNNLTVTGGAHLHYDQALTPQSLVLSNADVVVHGRHEVRAQ